MVPQLIPYPAIDPVLIEIGPLAIRWYALAYIAGLVFGWRFARHLASRKPHVLAPEKIDDFLVWATVGVVLGGRLGYVLFYKPDYYLQNPGEILELWHGGMSFHGGLVGVILAIVLFARVNKVELFSFADLISAAAPPGLFFGRLANFINGELYGRVTDVPWAMVFPHDPDQLPRHPSQLYQAGMEGLILFAVILVAIYGWKARWRPGLVSGLFCCGYAVARIIGEMFRQPDSYLGFVLGPFTMGQLLSVPALLFGLFLIARALHRPPVTGGAPENPAR